MTIGSNARDATVDDEGARPSSRPPRRHSWLVAKVHARDRNAADSLGDSGFWQHPADPSTWIAPESEHSQRQRDALARLRAAGLDVRAMDAEKFGARVAPSGSRSGVHFVPLTRMDGSLLAVMAEAMVTANGGWMTVRALRDRARRDRAELAGWRAFTAAALDAFQRHTFPATARVWLGNWLPGKADARALLLDMVRAAKLPRKRVIVDCSTPEPGWVRFVKEHFSLGVQIDVDHRGLQLPDPADWNFGRLAASPSALEGAAGDRLRADLGALGPTLIERIGIPV